MLPLSDLSITFNQSNDYLRLSLSLHALALLALYAAHCPYGYLACACCVLAWPMRSIARSRMPHPHVHSLSYHRQYWLLHTVTGLAIRYETMQIRVDTGFFMLIALRGLNQRKTVVIFHDQMTRDECRMLHVIETISQH